MINIAKSPCKGFTLMELMITMVILVVITSLAMPGYFSTVEKARLNEGVTTLNVIHMGQKIYRINNGTFWDDDGSPTWAEVSSALNVDLSPLYYTDFDTWTINGGTDYTVRLGRNTTEGGNGAWWIQYVGTATGNPTRTQNTP